MFTDFNPFTQLLGADWAVQIIVTLTIPIAMIAWRFPRRSSRNARAILALALLAAGTIGPVATGLVTGLDEIQSFAVFSVLLAVYVGIVMFICDVSAWQALFCATAGYTLQNLASGLEVLLSIVLSHRASGSLAEPYSIIARIVIPLGVYVAGYHLFARRIDHNRLATVEDKSMLLMFAVVVFVIIGFDIIIKGLVWDGIKYVHLVLLRLIHPLLCAFVLFAEYKILYAHRMSDERDETERILAERERQYTLSRGNIEAINIKCHDIRHQIHDLANSGAVVDKEVLESIAREVNVYDSVIETGNEALDTILTEKSLACTNENIVLSCIADGAALGFMSPSDIYSFFGNALDNAIEAVRQIDDPERRNITLNVAREGEMVAVNVENFYAVMPRFSETGLLTSKMDQENHGFGVKSMQLIAARYGGSAHFGTKDGVFYVNALFTGRE